MSNELDRKDLKIQALIETNAKVTNENADLRVELTIYDSEVNRLTSRVQELEALVPEESDTDDDAAESEDDS